MSTTADPIHKGELEFNQYECVKCQEVWQWNPEDYLCEGLLAFSPPDTCPLCSMSLSQMIRDVYKTEGLLEVIKMLIRRFL